MTSSLSATQADEMSCSQRRSLFGCGRRRVRHLSLERTSATHSVDLSLRLVLISHPSHHELTNVLTTLVSQGKPETTHAISVLTRTITGGRKEQTLCETIKRSGYELSHVFINTQEHGSARCDRVGMRALKCYRNDCCAIIIGECPMPQLQGKRDAKSVVQ